MSFKQYITEIGRSIEKPINFKGVEIRKDSKYDYAGIAKFDLDGKEYDVEIIFEYGEGFGWSLTVEFGITISKYEKDYELTNTGKPLTIMSHVFYCVLQIIAKMPKSVKEDKLDSVLFSVPEDPKGVGRRIALYRKFIENYLKTKPVLKYSTNQSDPQYFSYDFSDFKNSVKDLL
jgi:hypothetical protein